MKIFDLIVCDNNLGYLIKTSGENIFLKFLNRKQRDEFNNSIYKEFRFVGVIATNNRLVYSFEQFQRIIAFSEPKSVYIKYYKVKNNE